MRTNSVDPQSLMALLLLAVALTASQVALAAVPADRTPTGDTDNAVATRVGSRPPAGAQLAFVRDGQIYLINADGTGLIQLTNTGGGVSNGDPAWSRDGRRLAFSRGNPGDGVDGDRALYIMNADGSNVVQLTSGGYDIDPAWGPDDRTIAFTSRVGLSVVGVDADENPAIGVLLDRPGWNAQPAWSPDGRTITFSSDWRAYDFLFDLYAMDADGLDVRPLLEGPFFWEDGLTFYFESTWSPDGQSIAVVVCPYTLQDCSIAVANADGSGLRPITQGGSHGATWSPDGRWIAYGATPCPTCESSIRFVQVDGDADGLVVDDGNSPAWRPQQGRSHRIRSLGHLVQPANQP